MVRVVGVGVTPLQRSRLVVFDASEVTSTAWDKTDVTKIAIPRIAIMLDVDDRSFQKAIKRARWVRDQAFRSRWTADGRILNKNSKWYNLVIIIVNEA
jgi:hypothetical protein